MHYVSAARSQGFRGAGNEVPRFAREDSTGAGENRSHAQREVVFVLYSYCTVPYFQTFGIDSIRTLAALTPTITRALIDACNEYSVLYPYSELYLDEYHQRLFQWHISNLEFANGTNLCNLSLAEWNQDDEYSFTGSHVFGLYFVYKYIQALYFCFYFNNTFQFCNF